MLAKQMQYAATTIYNINQYLKITASMTRQTAAIQRKPEKDRCASSKAWALGVCPPGHESKAEA